MTCLVCFVPVCRGLFEKCRGGRKSTTPHRPHRATPAEASKKRVGQYITVKKPVKPHQNQPRPYLWTPAPPAAHTKASKPHTAPPPPPSSQSRSPPIPSRKTAPARCWSPHSPPPPP